MVINVNNLTFCYEGSFDNIFENVSFSIDTDWKLGFIGRNGKGKTTFARLLSGDYEYSGSISAPGVIFDYFPYEVSAEQAEKTASELMPLWKPGCEEWKAICELNRLNADAEILYRPFCTLSHGERTKIMLAVLFSEENDFLIIDEPTNHLDSDARVTVREYLIRKKSFILISHDRDLLDACTDHVLVLNRKSIEVQAGNFSGWWDNKRKKDAFSESENEKHLREIASLKKAADKTARWAEKNENTKIGFDPKREPDRNISTRAYIGAKTKKLQARVKSYEVRIESEINEKSGLLQDIEHPAELKLMPKEYFKDVLISARDYGSRYDDSKEPLTEHFDFELKRGERVFLQGTNGCGKSTFIKQILNKRSAAELSYTGELNVGSGLVISYISQDTGFLQGRIDDYCRDRELRLSLMLALLRQLDLERVQFEKPMESYSEGQKKKVLIAESLLTPAHLYIWDEPLNYIDVFSRMQIEELILKFSPTMLIVDHDVRFRDNVATRVADMP